MRNLILLIALVFILANSVYSQQVGDSTQEILDNVSSQQKPQAVKLDKETCKIFGIFNCPQPKVDYTHSDLLPKEVQIEEKNLSFWQKVGNFFKGLFDKSADPKSGYGYSYLPKEVSPVNEVADPTVSDISLETAIEQTHDTVKKSFLPYALSSKITPAPTSIAVVPSGIGSEITPREEIPPASGNSNVEYAKSLVATAGKSCGWTTANVRTRTLGCNNCTLPESKDAVPIRCLDGKVKPDVYLDLSVSANGNSWLQCVGYVIGVEQGMNRVLVSRNAKDYCLGPVPPGYVSVSKNNIAPGDIVANTEPPWGHIMIVLEVYKGSSSYKIAEANWTVSGSMSVGRIIYDSDIDCAFRPKG